MAPRQLLLQRPLVALDLETTGLDPNKDRIVEISCVRLHPDATRTVRTQRVNPEMPIDKGATLVHGIRDADVAHAPTWAQVARELWEFCANADLTGFNLEQFDLPILTREFGRAGFKFPADGVAVVDSWRIFTRKEPRDLAAAYRFYCGQELRGAHSAEADALAAADVLLAQVGRYPDLPTEVGALSALLRPASWQDWIDKEGKLFWKDNEIVLGFGKYKNRSLANLAAQEPDYLKWMVSKGDFSAQVIAVVQATLAGKIARRQGGTNQPEFTDPLPASPGPLFDHAR